MGYRRMAPEEEGVAPEEGVEEAELTAALYRHRAAGHGMGEEAVEDAIDRVRTRQGEKRPGDPIGPTLVDVAADQPAVAVMDGPAVERAARRVPSRVGELPAQALRVPVGMKRICPGQLVDQGEETIVVDIGVSPLAGLLDLEA